jgi:hypothetical protein
MKTTLAILAAVAVSACAMRPVSAPSVQPIQSDMQHAQTATSQADAKAAVILKWLKSNP